MGDSNYQITDCFHPCDLSVPFAGIFAIRAKKFLYCEMFICTGPIHISIVLKIGSYRLFILTENIFPKFVYIHDNIHSILEKLWAQLQRNHFSPTAYDSITIFIKYKEVV